MNMWAQNQLTASYYKGLTEESINKWADALGYDMTPKDPEKPEDDLKNMYRTAKKNSTRASLSTPARRRT